MTNNNQIHFENLWDKAEELQSEANQLNDTSSLINELILKSKLYQSINSNSSHMTEEDLQKIKLRALGEVLLVLTGISQKDNIDVYKALQEALQFKSIEFYDQKYNK